MFERNAKARADLSRGILYAVAGEAAWIYYGQVTPGKRIGFFRRRDRVIANVPDILSSAVMAEVGVGHRSIGAALRSGAWRKLGRFDLHDDLFKARDQVQWPVGTLTVTVWSTERKYDTAVDNPEIQDLEIIASWDAEQHIPKRLTADFGKEQPEWHVGGPVLRQRRVKEEYARRFPDVPWHKLPADWVPTEAC